MWEWRLDDVEVSRKEQVSAILTNVKMAPFCRFPKLVTFSWMLQCDTSACVK